MSIIVGNGCSLQIISNIFSHCLWTLIKTFFADFDHWKCALERCNGNEWVNVMFFHSGVLKVSPLSGTALNTSFELTAPEGWVDPDGDRLSYIFGYKTADRVVLFTSQVETISTTKLPPGNVTVLVFCIDTFGAFSSAEVEVHVQNAPISDDAFGNLEEKLAEQAALGDVGGLLGMYSTNYVHVKYLWFKVYRKRPVKSNGLTNRN